MAAYEVLLLNTAVPQIQAAQSGDTYVVPRDIAFSAALTLSAGTANGVPYLNGSKVLTTGSALTFDGTNLGVTGNAAAVIQSSVRNDNTATNAGAKLATFYSSTEITSLGHYWDGGQFLGTLNSLSDLIFARNNSEQMRLTSTGLGIGTSSPATKLDVNGLIRSAGDAANFLLLEKSANTGVYARWKRPNREYYLALDINNSGGNDFSLYDATAAATRWTVDDAGNLGLGVTPSAWGSGRRSLDVSNASFYSQTGNYNGVASNAYNNGSNWIYKTTAAAQLYEQGGGLHSWFTAPSGTAGNAISFTQALTLDANRNLLLNGTSAGASAVGTFAIFNGTAPTGSVTNGIILYAEDVSSSSELKVRDEAGNVTTLSPHNFSLIPEGPSEDMAWAYYSEKGGKRINVDMLKLARMVEKLTGEKLVYEN